ncbi:hypothetical protein DXG03_004635 [Asterophora parasitica]|uniref:Auxin efflux carrier n=1 Tax=Asterophora parasitica TaxID=117018 RepID=A0A9P7KCY3_9AGAR|nr:hypothetical protein DXG03_004635 [Asterophora parasitica]
MYMLPYRCKVTGWTGPAAVAPGSPGVWCEDNPSACVKGPKQMIYWNQLEGNNIEVSGTDLAGDPRSPAYNAKLGFANGVSYSRVYFGYLDQLGTRPGAQKNIFMKAGSATQTSVIPTSTSKPKPSNASSKLVIDVAWMGPLVLVAISYEAIGIAMAWIIKQFFWVPHRFRYGVLVAGGWGNVGDIPTSVIVSVTGAAPFNAATDQNLSVAYISVFILVFLLTLFPAGGHNWISMDYVGPDVEPEEVQEVVKRRRQAVLYAIPNAVARISGRPLRRRKRDETQKQNNNIASRGRFEEKARQEAEEPTDVEMSGNDPREGALGFSTATAAPLTSKHVSFYEDATTAVPTDGVRSPICSPTPTEAGYAISSPTPTTAGADAHKSILQTQEDVLPTTNQPAVAQKPSTDTSSTTQSGFSMRRLADPRVLRTFLSSLLSPPSIGILVSFPIALIPPLKGLFVPLPPSSSTSKFSNPHIPPAPDGLPPLSIILDTATFIGAAAVPLGLICLGAALARLNVARDQWRTLPTGAIGMLAVGKIIVAPILGVGIVTGLVNSGVISKEDKVLQFVCM